MPTHFGERKQHQNPHAGNVVKCVGHRRASVAARGGKNHDLTARFSQEKAEHAGHHLSGEILERRRWPAIQPQAINAFHTLDRFQRNFEVVNLTAHLRQRASFDHALRVTRQDAKGDFVVVQLRERGDFIRRQLRKSLREIKPAIRRLSGEECVAQVDARRFSVGAEKKKGGHAGRAASQNFPPGS